MVLMLSPLSVLHSEMVPMLAHEAEMVSMPMTEIDLQQSDPLRLMLNLIMAQHCLEFQEVPKLSNCLPALVATMRVMSSRIS